MKSIFKCFIFSCLFLGAANGFASSKLTTLETQKKLQQLGYNPGPIDGVKGNRTKAAIENFQQNLQVTVNGEITSSLLDSLSSPCKRIFLRGLPVKTGACKKELTNAQGSEVWQAKPGEEPIEIIFD